MAVAAVAGELADLVSAISSSTSAAATGEVSPECVRLARKVFLLSHVVDEIRAFAGASQEAPVAELERKPEESLGELLKALRLARRLPLCAPAATAAGAAATTSGCSDSAATAHENFSVQLKYVTWLLERALANIPYDYFQISSEVQEQVDLVRAQLRREIGKRGSPDVAVLSEIHDILLCLEDNVEDQATVNSESEASHSDNLGDDSHDLQQIVSLIAEINKLPHSNVNRVMLVVSERCRKSRVVLNSVKPVDQSSDAEVSGRCRESGVVLNSVAPVESGDAIVEKAKNSQVIIPEDFRCPISLEMFRDPVIVSTGQTYERVFIQRWIDGGNRTCPKTQQKLQNFTLTPNYVLRSLISQWCEQNGVDPPCRSKGDGSSVDRATMEALVRGLSSASLDEQKTAAGEIRSLAKRNTENRILLAEAGAIPALVTLLTSKDPKMQEHAVTSLLNLSIYDHNKELIVFAGAILPIIQVLRNGSMEARENAAAAIFSLSLIDENKITIGSMPGAMEALVELLDSGSSRGRKDAATALFNLCIYQANKVRAVRAGILPPLIRMLQDSSSSNGAVDEALTILSVLVSHHECKAAISKANAIPVLIDLLRSGQARNKENAAAILLALCKKDAENLACIGRLGALIPLTELTKTGTDRAKRKATSLLEHLSKLKVF